MASISIKLDRESLVYRPNEKVCGVISIVCDRPTRHAGIDLKINSDVKMELSARSVGLFEAFYSKLKPIDMIDSKIQLSPAAKLKRGLTEIPFGFVLGTPHTKREMLDTYHGVYINVMHTVTARMKMGLLAVDPASQLEFRVEVSGKEELEKKAVSFKITPTGIKNLSRAQQQIIPNFEIEGKIDSTLCDLTKPFTGEVVVRSSESRIRSIVLQLVRVEICKYSEGEAKEATEVQSVEIAKGDVVPNLPIPIHMPFPRVFTCPTIRMKQLRVEFETNLIVEFEHNHMITENFPLVLYRSGKSTTGL
mmetsp:Transcript_4819/g.7149  ORF Transcript_4819/g.7149 Transcript_4819/m.7149 type:complete len:306 (-) Transcript_4819:170-1087(-)|eukprot:CAMPEP_0167755746 /NCGR_PEP_ID=MMETSP0110_2-20121227/8998_1 /TAXON_ID=629695 /ORGANISM="Gymnochlora sp., Strain CCMP2014" /LENGTH=305 /DNA_ID=CAMNT_0007641773 /DNA_START=67 /DNA_END=984 /DNA_ORIENTATION=+